MSKGLEKYINRIICAIMEDILPDFPSDSFDCCVTDPPYGLKFMGKKWDYSVPSVEQWAEVYRILKPGAHLLAFFGTRTYHRGVINIEDAGFEIRDQIGWIYGSGFPKSLDVSKAIDKAAGAEREVVGIITEGRAATPRHDIRGGRMHARSEGDTRGYLGNKVTAPATKAAELWNGWGTALKPAWECVCVARKPLSGTVVDNVLQYGTGAINIDGCRIPVDPSQDDMLRNVKRKERDSETWKYGSGFRNETNYVTGVRPNGRFPANIIHDGGYEVLEYFGDAPGQQGDKSGLEPSNQTKNVYGQFDRRLPFTKRNEQNSSAARFFYCAKASPSERGENNTHPTVKPVDLMKYLIKLVCPPGGLLIDPFAGSCTTGIAAHLLGAKYVLIDKDKESVEIGIERLKRSTAQLNMFVAK